MAHLENKWLSQREGQYMRPVCNCMSVTIAGVRLGGTDIAVCRAIAGDSRLISYTLNEELRAIAFKEEFGTLESSQRCHPV